MPYERRTSEWSHSARPSAACTPSPWVKSCSANSPSLLQLLDQLGDLGPDGHALQRHDALAGVGRAEEVGQADAVVLRLPREGEPLELHVRVLRVVDDQLVPVGVAGEVADLGLRAAGSPARATCARAAARSPRTRAAPSPRPSRRARPSGACRARGGPGRGRRRRGPGRARARPRTAARGSAHPCAPTSAPSRP